jgi:V-type H+-transporting ATPase subunit a
MSAAACTFVLLNTDDLHHPFQEMQTDPSKVVRLGFVTGLVPKAKSIIFERVLFRATRGNMYLRLAPVESPVTDPQTGEQVSCRRV